jgi:ketosteroid isomerase-like protein
VSQEDVDLVRRLVAPAEIDWAAIVRSEELYAPLESQVQDLFDPDFECALVGVTEKRRRGFEGLREIWLDWLEPWASYRAEEERVIDLEDGRVLWLGHDYGGRRDGLGELELLSSSIWTIREGKVAAIVFYATRDDAFAAAGLGDEAVPHGVLADDPGVDEAQ